MNLYVVTATDPEGFVKAKWIVSLRSGEHAAEAVHVITANEEDDSALRIPPNTELSAIPFDIMLGEYVPVWIEGCQHIVQFG